VNTVMSLQVPQRKVFFLNGPTTSYSRRNMLHALSYFICHSVSCHMLQMVRSTCSPQARHSPRLCVKLPVQTSQNRIGLFTISLEKPRQNAETTSKIYGLCTYGDMRIVILYY
jgi:hypothetical protein